MTAAQRNWLWIKWTAYFLLGMTPVWMAVYFACLR